VFGWYQKLPLYAFLVFIQKYVDFSEFKRKIERDFSELDIFRMSIFPKREKEF
jgi:hypothetical protein